MVTARNYAAQAEYALRRGETLTLSIKSDAAIKTLASLIGESVHFAIPDGGKVLDSDHKGLFNQPLNLPYDYVSVEYFTQPNEEHVGVSQNQLELDLMTGKRVIIAHQTEENVTIYTIKHLASVDKWLTAQVGIEMERGQIFTSIEELKCKILLMDDSTEQDREADSFVVSRSIDPLFELLEALSCKNVSTEPIEKVDQNKNAKRIKAGKVPIYETKVLVVNTTQYNSKGERTGTHASPRQHLRRGHIRRYKSGINIWVNSTVVGDPSKGVINKTYIVK